MLTSFKLQNSKLSTPDQQLTNKVRIGSHRGAFAERSVNWSRACGLTVVYPHLPFTSPVT